MVRIFWNLIKIKWYNPNHRSNPFQGWWYPSKEVHWTKQENPSYKFKRIECKTELTPKDTQRNKTKKDSVRARP